MNIKKSMTQLQELNYVFLLSYLFNICIINFILLFYPIIGIIQFINYIYPIIMNITKERIIYSTCSVYNIYLISIHVMSLHISYNVSVSFN